MKIDLKSALCGLCLGALLALGIGAVATPTPPLYFYGKYQVAGGASQFVILDTTTGQAWLGDFHSPTLNPVPPDAPFFQPKILISQ